MRAAAAGEPAAEGGYEPSRRQLTAMVAAGSSGLFSTGSGTLTLILPLTISASGALERPLTATG